MQGQRKGIKVSKGVSSLVKEWLYSSDYESSSSINLPATPTIAVRPDRLGLGAECDEEKRKEKEEKSLILKRMQRKIVPKGLTDSPPTKKQRTHRDQQESELEDEEDSRTNIAMSAKSRRRKLEMLKKIKLDKKHFKKKKKKTNLASRDEGTKCRGNPLNHALIKSEVGIGTDNQLLSIETGNQDTVPPLNKGLPPEHKGKDEDGNKVGKGNGTTNRKRNKRKRST